MLVPCPMLSAFCIIRVEAKRSSQESEIPTIFEFESVNDFGFWTSHNFADQWTAFHFVSQENINEQSIYSFEFICSNCKTKHLQPKIIVRHFKALRVPGLIRPPLCWKA